MLVLQAATSQLHVQQQEATVQTKNLCRLPVRHTKQQTDKVIDLLVNTVKHYFARRSDYFPQELIETNTDLKRVNIGLGIAR